MALWDRVQHFFALEPWREPELQTRSGDDSSIADLLARFNVRGTVWRPAGVREALGVPAIHSAVTLISNTVGALSLEAYRKGVKLGDDDRPRLIVRPNPFTRPHEFFRDTAYSMATRGEAWWWTAARDVDGAALSLIPIDPAEIVVTEDEADLRFPKIEWRGRRMPNADMTQITLQREPGALRGHGPLQMCGAAVSVAVEAQEWAANFYADGGLPGLLIKHAGSLDPTPRNELGEPDPNGKSEAYRLLEQWTDRANNGTRVIDQAIEKIDYLTPNPQGAQMLDSRNWENGEAARMFRIPGSLMEYATAGSSLTYQNVSQELDKFTRTCLWPNYLEPIEQAMSDLLTRSTITRFNLDGLLRADVKTRWDVYRVAVDVLGQEAAAELAARAEGLTPGDIENAPVPLAVPQAIPTQLPIQTRSDGELVTIRCPQGHRVGDVEAGARAALWCRHCKISVAA